MPAANGMAHAARLRRSRGADRTVGPPARHAAGRVVADLDPATVTPADLGSYMTGVANGGASLMFERIWRASLAPLAATAAAIVISSIALLISGNNPVDAFREMWQTIDSTESVVLIINRAVPYYIAGVAVAIGFKMNLFNIGSNGQYLLAALIAGWAGAQVSLPAADPRGLRLPRRHHRRRHVGVDRGDPERHPQRQRGHRHDHAELHRDRPRGVPPERVPRRRGDRRDW